MKKLLVAAAVAGLVGTANAQSAFEGFYGQLGAGYENNSINSDTYNVSNAPTVGINMPSVSKGTGQINVGLGYNFSVTKQFLLGIGAEYYAISPTLTTSDISNTTLCGGSCGVASQYKISNRYSIFVTPGYALDKDSLIYAKAGYSNQTIKSTEVQSSNIDADNGTGTTSSVGGYVLGLGYKQMITGGFYGFGEFNYYSYSGASGNMQKPTGYSVQNLNPTSSAYNFLVGVGYRF